MAESFWYIKKCDLFSQVSGDDIAWLESHARVRRMKRGEPIYLPSQSADGVMLVASGRVKICHTTPDGKQSIIDFVDEGEVFGELALLDFQQRDEYAETTEKTTIILIPKRADRLASSKGRKTIEESSVSFQSRTSNPLTVGAF